MFDVLLSQLKTDVRAALGTCVDGLIATARERLEIAHVDVAKERAEGLIDVAEERTKALAEIGTRRAELGREIEAMHMHTQRRRRGA
jgi:transposase